MKKLFAILIAIEFCFNVISQETRIWTRDFETNLSNYYVLPPKLKTAGDTIIVTGVKNTSSGQRLLTVKYNIAGDILSTIEYGKDSVSNNFLIDYKFDAKNYVYLIQKEQFDLPRTKIIIQKYTIEGKLEWIQQIQPTGFYAYSPHSLGLINDTCLFISAYKQLDEEWGGWMTYIPYLYAYNVDGKQLWTKEFDKETEIKYFAHDIFCYNNAAYLFNELYDDDYRIVKVDIQNNITVDTKTGFDGINDVQLTADTNLLISSPMEYRITKINLDGTVIWSEYYGTNLLENVTADEVITFIQDSHGNIYITGRHYGEDSDTDTNADILTIKYDKQGNLIWENRYEYNLNNADIGNTLCLKNDFIYVGGQSQRLGIGTDNDYVVLKLDTITGANEGGTYRFNGNSNGDDVVTSLSVFDDGKVALTGLSYSNTSFDWTTQLLSNVANSIPQIKNNSEILIYPNPVNKNGTLHISNNNFNRYIITDIKGRIITKGILNKLTKNNISANNLNRGVYFMTLRNKDDKITNKLIVK